MLMAEKRRRAPVPDKWGASILNLTQDGGLSLYDALETNRKERERLLTLARTHLVMSPLTPLVADAVAAEIGLPEGGNLVLDEQGALILDVPPGTDGRRRRWRSRLPDIQVLRDEAEAKGVDISDLGCKKKLIIARLALVADLDPEPAPIPRPRKKRVKTAPAVTAPTVVKLEPEPPATLEPEPTEDRGRLLDDGGAPSVGDLNLFGDDPPDPPPPEAVPAPTQKKPTKKSRLQVVVEDAEDIALAAILAKNETPPE